MVTIMAKKERTPEQKAKAKRSVWLNQIRNALVDGNEKQAYRLCEKHGYDIFEARLAKEYKSPAESWFVAKEAEMKALAEQPETKVDVAKRTTPTNSIFAPEVVAVLEEKAASESEMVSMASVTQDACQIAVGLPAVASNEPSVKVEVSPEPKKELDGRLIGGWPLETVAEVWGQPRNPQLMIALLPDQRKVSLYQDRYRKLKIYDKVTIRLAQPWADQERFGDPCYENISQRQNTW